MTYSVNEIQTLAQKAARGAGFPAAQSETFGRAAVFHLAQGGAPDPLLRALRDPTDSPVLRLPLLMDDVLRARHTLGNDVTLSLHEDEDGTLATVYAQTLPVAVKSVSIELLADTPSKLHISTQPEGAPRNTLPARIIAPETLVAALSELAANTYVPSSDASRQSGAGAGLTDND